MNSPVEHDDIVVSTKPTPSQGTYVLSDPPSWDGPDYVGITEAPQSLSSASSALERGTTIMFNIDQGPPTSPFQHGSPGSSLSAHRLSQRIVADTASVLTIASSSKRRRRRSLDTNASTRALVAESIFSNSESIEELQL